MTPREYERLRFAKSHDHKEPEIIVDNRKLFHWSAVIGKDGFGYARDERGELVKIPHAGGVRIGKDVEIGAHSVIDRATVHGQFTEIGDGTKIDNIVHVAHNVKIGKNCLIVAGTVIGGSAIVGDNCFLGINCSIKNKIKIGNNVTIGMGSVVITDIPDGETWAGNPARKIETKLK